MAAGKEIKRLRGKSVSAAQTANLIGVGVDRLRKWEERDVDPSDSGDIQKVEQFFGRKLSELPDLKSFDIVHGIRETERSLAEGKTDNATLLQVLSNLSASHLQISQSNNKLAENEKMIIARIPIANAPTGIQATEPAILSGLLEALAQVASGTRWHSKEEAIRELGRILGLQEDGNAKMSGILSGERK